MSYPDDDRFKHQIARNAICLYVRRNRVLKSETGLDVVLMIGHKIWCLDGMYYVSEDTEFNGSYLVRRGRAPLNAVLVLTAVADGSIVVSSRGQLRNLPVEVIGV